MRCSCSEHLSRPCRSGQPPKEWQQNRLSMLSSNCPSYTAWTLYSAVWKDGICICRAASIHDKKGAGYRTQTERMEDHHRRISLHLQSLCCHFRRRTGKFLFDFTISPGFPHDAPKVKCKTKVWLCEGRLFPEQQMMMWLCAHQGRRQGSSTCTSHLVLTFHAMLIATTVKQHCSRYTIS